MNDIVLNNDQKKKSFREGIAYDLFDESDQSVFGILQVGKTDHEKCQKFCFRQITLSIR